MDVPAAGSMAETPPWLLAFRTPSPTIGHRKAPSVPVWSADGTPAVARLVIAPRTAARATKRARCGSKRRLVSERSIGCDLACEGSALSMSHSGGPSLTLLTDAGRLAQARG